MIFTARQLHEKCREQHQRLHMAFIDLKKAFDSVNREALWKVLSRAGCPNKFITILKLLHDKMSATVLIDTSETEAFEVKTGVKHSCVIAPTLFSIFIAAITHLVKNKLPSGVVVVVYQMDRKLFNLSRLKPKRKTVTTSLIELQYADVNAVVAASKEKVQAILNVFAEGYRRIGLSLNLKKTQILHQPAPDGAPDAPSIRING